MFRTSNPSTTVHLATISSGETWICNMSYYQTVAKDHANATGLKTIMNRVSVLGISFMQG
jgi:hypothetical protein